jgi:D-alanyl-lipoteichoic acid acyltransferase DltB (MBOAT superfamily)
MLFNSLEFFLFLPVVFILYWFVFNKSLEWQNVLVLAASYFFYGWWSWKFLGLLVLSTLLDFGYGFMVGGTDRKKAKLFLWLSIINNLGILAIFKYYDFFAKEFVVFFRMFGWEMHPFLLNFALPIGISFYTFHGMSYVFDIFKGKQKPVEHFVEYAVFVSFFPLLVAGPIERASHLLPQIQKSRFFDYTKAVEGCRLILWGLFKKVVIADGVSVIADQIYNNSSASDSLGLIVGAVAFSIQIYGDFSGYSDIAIGTAKLFGFELLSNFRFPYFSRDIAEFWRRWHISLSTWFRDYLYIPLGGSKSGKWKAIRNTFIIFLVSGFWHGASWNYLIWGGIHAVGFLPLLLMNKNRTHVTDIVASKRTLPSLLELRQMVMTFSFVTLAWVFFRAGSLEEAIVFLKNLVTGINGIYGSESLMLSMKVLGYAVPFMLAEWYLRFDERKLRVPIFFRYIVYMGIVIVVFFLIIRMKEHSFIYFQF